MGHNWQCLGLTFVSVVGATPSRHEDQIVCRDWTPIGHVQSKYPSYCTFSLAQRFQIVEISSNQLNLRSILSLGAEREQEVNRLHACFAHRGPCFLHSAAWGFEHRARIASPDVNPKTIMFFIPWLVMDIPRWQVLHQNPNVQVLVNR